MTTSHTTWTHDPTEQFSPPIYRRGIWHFQAHPAVVVMLLSTWMAVPAFWMRSTLPGIAGWVQFSGLVWGTVMAMFLASYHISRAHDRRHHVVNIAPYSIGILEHLTVLGYVALLLQMCLLD